MNKKTDVYDCVIVGGGAAGLSAALALGRARRRVLVCDTDAPRNASARRSHNFFTRDNTNPFELLRIGREQLKPYSTVKLLTIGVKEIKKSEQQFELVLENGVVKKARKILLAYGVKDEFPAIENFGDFWGKTVFHCPFCHGWEVRDRPLAIFGNGANGIEMAVLLKNWSADLVVCTNGKAEFSAEQKKWLDRHAIAVREEKAARLVGTNGCLEAIVFETGEYLARSGALFRPKHRPVSDFAEKLGCESNDTGILKTTSLNETIVEGIYVAVDLASPLQSIALAVAGGAVAAVSIFHALNGEDFI